MDALNKERIEVCIKFGNIVSLTIDGASNMTGKMCAITETRSKMQFTEFYYIFYQEYLHAKNRLKLLENVMSLVIKNVIFIAAHALNNSQSY